MTEKVLKEIAAEGVAHARAQIPDVVEVLPSFSFGDLYLDICRDEGAGHIWSRMIFYPEGA